MDENLKTMYEVCEIFSESLKDAKDKLRKSSGPVSVGDADYVDKLAHTIKSLETTIAMKEANGEEGGYSGHYMMPRYAYNDGRSYARRNSYAGDGYGGMSNARGRVNNPTGRNQYSRERGYSYADSMNDLLEDMRGMMGELPEDKRRKAERLIDELSR